MGLVFFGVLIAASLQKMPLPLSLPALLIDAVDAWEHECGHAITGIIFGIFSVPLLMLTLPFPYSWTFQIVVWIALIGGCIYTYLKKREIFIGAVIFTIIAIALSFTPYTDLIISYMGHGGAILFGGFFMYKAWAYKGDNIFNQIFIAIIGVAPIINNIIFCYNLSISADARGKYTFSSFLAGVHNDFSKISLQTSLTVQQIAIFTIILAIVVTVTAFLLAIFPASVKDKPDADSSYKLL